MLNQPLYDALKKLFIHVDIVAEGQHAYVEPSPSGAGDWQLPQDAERGEQYRVNCPFCKDHHKHLYISYLSYARPVVDGVPLRIGRLLAKCFRRECLENKENQQYLEGRIGWAMGGTAIQIPVEQDSAAQEQRSRLSSEVSLDGFRTWVPDWQPVTDDAEPVILKYLADRRVTMTDVEALHIGYGPVLSPNSGKYLNDGHPWVLFPIVNNGILKGVQARCPDVFLTSSGIKYWFHPAFRKTTALFNVDRARQHGVAVVCEGVFDVVSVGKPGVCCFGHTPSAMQLRMLSGFDRGLVWQPDTDVRPDLDTIAMARKHVDAWNAEARFEQGAHLVVLPGKDAGELSRQQVWETILQQVSCQMADYLLSNVVTDL